MKIQSEKVKNYLQHRTPRTKFYHRHQYHWKWLSCPLFAVVECLKGVLEGKKLISSYLWGCFRPSSSGLDITRRLKCSHLCPYHRFWRQLNKIVEKSFKNNLHLSLESLSPFTLNCETPSMNSIKSTSPFPSWSKISITRWTSGFWCNSGRLFSFSSKIRSFQVPHKLVDWERSRIVQIEFLEAFTQTRDLIRLKMRAHFQWKTLGVSLKVFSKDRRGYVCVCVY